MVFLALTRDYSQFLGELKSDTIIQPIAKNCEGSLTTASNGQVVWSTILLVHSVEKFGDGF